eukprot:5245985-Pleurochrysis_carterae.AAC.2
MASIKRARHTEPLSPSLSLFARLDLRVDGVEEGLGDARGRLCRVVERLGRRVARLARAAQQHNHLRAHDRRKGVRQIAAH